MNEEISNLKRIDESEINRRIVLLFLEKLELLSEKERHEIFKVIMLIGNPIFIVNNTPNLTP